MNVMPPVRVRREYVQKLEAPPAEVFPMLCPVREVEWAGDWDPYVVYAVSGVAEPDCVFTTRDDDGESVWVITRHDPEGNRLEMLRVTPGSMVRKLEFALHADGEGATRMDVAYTFTALGQAGRQLIGELTEERWNEQMQTFERELNHYLASGSGPEGGEPRYE